MTTEEHLAKNCEGFEDWWNDQDDGCPTLVLNTDQELAKAAWIAAIESVKNKKP